MNPNARPHCHGCGRFWATGHVCPPPGRYSRRHDDYIGESPLWPLVAEAVEPALRLVMRYGSVKQAGEVYSERHGLARKSGERLLHRIIHGHVQRVQANTVDRLEVLV